MSESVVRLQGVTKSFGEQVVLQDVNLTAARGEVLVLIGPSGAGKSTLVRAIAGLERIDAGRIDVGRTGMVFQAFHLFPHLSVLENVTLAPRKVARRSREDATAEAMALLRRFQIQAHAQKFPEQLSGGQQQRVAIARALAMQPEVMLFDEPTSALDPESATEVLDAIRDVADGGVTSLVVTHQMGFARNAADRVVFLERGRIVEIAPPEEFFTQPKHERTREWLGRMLKY